MSHTSEKRWLEVSNSVSAHALETINALNSSRELFQQLFEAWDFAGGTAAGFASLLFKEAVSARDPAEPTTAEIAMAQDLANAVIALNNLWEYANNTPNPVAEDRAQKLRRVI